MQVKLYEQWYAGCDSNERIKRYEQIVSNSGSLRVLRTILEKDLRNAQEQAFSEKNYSEPAWAEKQADLLGQIRTYNNILKLLKFLDE